MMINLEIIKKTKGGYFINFGDIYSGDRKNYLVNGKPFLEFCKSTELTHWWECEEYPVELTRKSQEMINPRYVSTSPYVAKSDISAEEYQNLPEGLDDYYERTGEYSDVFTLVPFQISSSQTELEVSNIKYLGNIDVSLLHEITYPKKEWINLPCTFHRDVVWTILCKELAERVNKNYLEVDMYEYSGEIRLYRKNPFTQEKHSIYVIKRDHIPPLVGKDYGDLLRNLDLFIESLIEPYNKPIVKCPYCSGKSFVEFLGKELSFDDFVDMVKIEIRKLTNFVTSQGKKDRMNTRINDLFRDLRKEYSGTVYISRKDNK